MARRVLDACAVRSLGARVSEKRVTATVSSNLDRKAPRDGGNSVVADEQSGRPYRGAGGVLSPIPSCFLKRKVKC